MRKQRIALNGLGRIGRLVLRKLVDDERFEIVAVNDVAPLETLAYLLKYSSEHGAFKTPESICCSDKALVINGKSMSVFSEINALKLPWNDLSIDLVLECSGSYTSRKKAQAHLDAGAGKVLVSAAAGKDVPTVVYGINEETLKPEDTIVSGASCSTVGLTPLARALNEIAPIEHGISTTIHALTPTQMTLDNPQAKGNLRRSRTASTNIIPTSAAAATAVGLVVPELAGKLSGSAIRVPVTQGSLITLYATVKSETLTAEELNSSMKERSSNLFGYTDEELVSSDIAGTEYESIFDATQTKVAKTSQGTFLVQTAAWFDNETSYVVHFIALAAHLGQL